jgi:hypothetical protein
MLMMSPHLQKYLARQAAKKARAALRFKDRAGLIRSIGIVVSEALDAGEATTHWTFEGMLIAILRAEMCLRSIPWRDADEAARAVVIEALTAIGAKRPSWQEGQPEWTDGGVIRETRTLCANCEGPLPEGHKVYCGKICGDAARARRYWHDMEDARRAELNLIRSRRQRGARA